MLAARTCQRPTTPKGGSVVNFMLSADMTLALGVEAGIWAGAAPAHRAHVVA